MVSTRPNVLLVMADQLAPHFTGAYGHQLVKTPHLVELAARGARFDAAYCHSPLCAPARFAMMAGRSVSALGAWDNAAEFAAATPTIAHFMSLAGYRTVLAGKMHFVGPDQLHGFDERLTTDVYPADFAWTPDWTRPEHRFETWFHNMDPIHQAGQAVTTHQLDYDEEVGYVARRKLHDLARDSDERPFFMVASFIHPHDPYVARPEWWNLYDHDAIDLPGSVNHDELDAHSRRIRAGIQADTVGCTEAQVRSARHGYYANVSYVDNWLGSLVATLEETGQIDNTIIIFTSDHGDMLGDRGLWFKMSFHERSARVPFVMAGPGCAIGEVDNVMSHLDLAPTLLDIATEGAPTSDMPWRGWDLELALDGRSVWNLASGDTDDVSETTAEYMAEMTSHPMFMIRRGSLKYIHCDGDPALLYDLHTDPLERTNLAAHPERAAEVAAFEREIDARWDRPAIRQRVLESQRSRHLLHRARAASGANQSWDHLPRNDVANSYVRNHQDVVDASLRSRLHLRPSKSETSRW